MFNSYWVTILLGDMVPNSSELSLF